MSNYQFAQDYLQKAIISENQGNYDEALKNYRKCVSYDDGIIPTNEEEAETRGDIFIGWLRYAGLLRDAENWDHAIKAAQRAADVPSLKFSALLIMGECQQALEQADQAEQTYREALEIRPAPEIWMILGNLLHEHYKDRGYEALDCLQKALEVDPDYEEAHFNLGYYCRKEGDYEKAIDHLKKAIDIDPEYAEAHSELAYTLWLNRRYSLQKSEAALQRTIKNHFETSIDLNPEDASTLYYYGKVLKDWGRILEATKMLGYAISFGHMKAWDLLEEISGGVATA